MPARSQDKKAASQNSQELAISVRRLRSAKPRLEATAMKTIKAPSREAPR